MPVPRVRNRLSRALYRRSWTDQRLATATSIPRSRINQIKNCAAQPTVAEALAIAAALEEPVAELFYFERDPAHLTARGL